MTGLYGKLPSKGDFVRRRLPGEFVEPWDAWLRNGMTAYQDRFGDSWLELYLTSPLWRFVLASGTCGEACWAGVVMPSVDKVGRYFPMTVATELPADSMPVMVGVQCSQWFVEIEQCVLNALEAETSAFDDFDVALQALTLEFQPSALRARSGELPTQAGEGVCWPLQDDVELGRGLAHGLLGPLRSTLNATSVWWTEGSDLVEPCMLHTVGLPTEGMCPAFLDGQWMQHGWQTDEVAAG